MGWTVLDGIDLDDEQCARIREALDCGHTVGPAIEGVLILDDPDGNGVKHQLTFAGTQIAKLLHMLYSTSRAYDLLKNKK